MQSESLYEYQFCFYLILPCCLYVLFVASILGLDLDSLALPVSLYICIRFTS
jgi:hypothetical protein